MNSFKSLACFLLFQIFFLSPVFGYCDWESNGSYREYVCDDLAAWVIVTIIIGTIITIVVPLIVLCFCFGWCCFSSRRSTRGQVYAPQVISTVQPNYHPGPGFQQHQPYPPQNQGYYGNQGNVNPGYSYPMQPMQSQPGFHQPQQQPNY